MSSTYLIQIKKDDEIHYIFAYMEVNTNHNFSTITVCIDKNKFSSKNKILLNIYIYNQDYDITFDKSLMELYINNFIIKFDNSSSSAWDDFLNNLNKIINTNNEIIKYESGNIKYVGDILKDDNEKYYHGTGTLFYDTPLNKIKYTGEFKMDKYDGSGTFFFI